MVVLMVASALTIAGLAGWLALTIFRRDPR
jgi:hypothetical protein